MNTEKAGKKRIIGIIIAAAVIIAAVAVPFGLRAHKYGSTEVLTQTVTVEELSELEKYKALRELDLSGSTCYDAILTYAKNHPETDVRYTVDIDGTAVSNTETALDWSGRDISALTAAEPAYLPALEKIELGRVSAEELKAVHECFPNAALGFETKIAGKTVNNTASSLDLSALSHADAAEAAELLGYLPELKDVKLGDIAFDDYKLLFDARPDICFDYSFELFGKTVSTLDDTIKYKKVYVGDEGLDTLRGILPYMPKLTYLRLDRCETTDAATEALNLEFPDVKIVWRIFFSGFSCLTDAEKIWAIGSLYDEDCIPLQYCHDIKYLDLGHNAIEYIDFVSQMPLLEVFIVSHGTTVDISPLAGHEHLEYLEVSCTRVSDLSPLATCPNLKHLEISLNHRITDITPLYGLDLERFYSLYNNVYIPLEQYEEFAALHPDCEIDHGCGRSLLCPLVESNWRYADGVLSERYALLREQIGYDDPFGPTRLYAFLDEGE